MPRQQKKDNKVSLRDIAKVAGISQAAVGYALQKRAGVSKATRERVLQVAREMGYVPDARVASWMSKVRATDQKELIPIAWLNTHSEKDAWQKYRFLSPYLEGAKDCARQFGYRLEEIWVRQPNMSMRRIARIIDQRGIEGVIITAFLTHFKLNWDRLAAACIEGPMFRPKIHRVLSDHVFNLLLALKTVRRHGYQRIGICLEKGVDSHLNHLIAAKLFHFNATLPKSRRVQPLFYCWPYGDEGEARKTITAWVRRTKPDVIVGHAMDLVADVQAAGYRVPEDVGVVHLAIDDDVLEWAGINSKRREIGRVAAEKVISLMQNRQFGLPETAQHILIRGEWSAGRTLLGPKPMTSSKRGLPPSVRASASA